MVTRILVKKGSGTSILFSNYFERMSLPQDVNILDTEDINDFDSNGSHHVSCMLLYITFI